MRRFILLSMMSSVAVAAPNDAKKCSDGDAEACATAGIDTRSDRDELGYFDRSCKLGSSGSCILLALSHREGRGVAKDLAKTVALFECACTLKSRQCNFLGLSYANGEDVHKDAARARGLFEQACDARDAEACFNLAISLERFDGGDRDEVGALDAYRRSCDGDFADACFNLGYAYERGESSLTS